MSLYDEITALLNRIGNLDAGYFRKRTQLSKSFLNQYRVKKTQHNPFSLQQNCYRIHSRLTAVHCFDEVCVGEQPVAWKEYCAEYCLKKLQESMHRGTGCRDITEITSKAALNTNQSIFLQHLFLKLVFIAFTMKYMYHNRCLNWRRTL